MLPSGLAWRNGSSFCLVLPGEMGAPFVWYCLEKWELLLFGAWEYGSPFVWY
jgi:hypothetical protein